MGLKKHQNLEHNLEKDPLAEEGGIEKPVFIEPKEALSAKEKQELAEEVLPDKAERRPVEKKKFPFAKKPSIGAQAVQKSLNLVKIESILEEDLEDVYFKMEPQLQEDFKTKGEETAAEIEKLLEKTKVKTKKIFQLIVGWLRMVPGVNKFFLRQEAKIKTDKIIKLKEGDQ